MVGRHEAAEALDWNEAMALIESLCSDGKYREAMLIASGCFLGLRISDILTLRWEDVLSGERVFRKVEKKTGKTRLIRFNVHYLELAERCRKGLGMPEKGYIFTGQKSCAGQPVTRQCTSQILARIKSRYGIKSARVFSTHSLRKTFGRRVWELECGKGRGDLALSLLQDAFNHSNVNITKRYLGIRQEEILSLYDSLM